MSPGYFADFAALSEDYFSVDENQIRGIESVLTVMDGKVVYGSEEFAALSPDLPPASPDWSPVKHYGGYCNDHSSHGHSHHRESCHDHGPGHKHIYMNPDGRVWESNCGCSV